MPSPEQPDSPQAQPQRPRPRSRRGGARVYSPGSDATTRRLVSAGERRARRERQQSGERSTAPASSEPAKPAEPAEPAAAAKPGVAAEPAEAAEPAAAAEPGEAAESAAASAAVKQAGAATKSRETGQPAEPDGVSGSVADEDEDEEVSDTAEPSQDLAKARAKRRSKAREIREKRRGPLLPVALGIATLVLGGLAAWFGAEAHSLTSIPAAGNSALTDAAATSAVRNQVGSAIATLFSYDYRNPGPTTRAEKRLLTGPAVGQYAKLFAQVHKNAPGQKLIVTTAITSVGVEMLTGNQARLLIFATETDTRTGGGQPASAAAMLAVNAVRQGSTWKIEAIDTY